MTPRRSWNNWHFSICISAWLALPNLRRMFRLARDLCRDREPLLLIEEGRGQKFRDGAAIREKRDRSRRITSNCLPTTNPASHMSQAGPKAPRKGCARRKWRNGVENHQAGKKLGIPKINTRKYFAVNMFSDRGSSRIRAWRGVDMNREMGSKIDVIAACGSEIPSRGLFSWECISLEGPIRVAQGDAIRLVLAHYLTSYRSSSCLGAWQQRTRLRAAA
jgi:hypothetical protein